MYIQVSYNTIIIMIEALTSNTEDARLEMFMIILKIDIKSGNDNSCNN